MDDVPVGKFGALATVDRTEIEAYRAIHNLMSEYVELDAPERPLSIAVFGPPGSGKSFGVTQVARSIAPGRLHKIEFNFSQFEDEAGLIRALHATRDVALSGRIPLVFFDEFDSAAFGQPLGWLKYFLAPMQDGRFLDGAISHPVGQAIFVFAGGTSSTFQQFSRQCVNTDTSEGRAEVQSFARAKGPDFVSRLRGFINVLGPNPAHDGDRFYVVRRAMLIRFMLKSAAPQIFEGGRARVDAGVARALVKAPFYRHGIRSLESVINMSTLSGRRRFGSSALPSVEQLDLHVEPEAFLELVRRDTAFGAAVERIARAIHAAYREAHQGELSADDPAMRPWDGLSQDLKESNRRQAASYPAKLRAIGCGFKTVAQPDPEAVVLDDADVETLAALEHDRWANDRLMAGWRLGPRDPERFLNPHLVPYSDLDEATRQFDRDAVRKMPQHLADAGFEIHRLS